MKSQLAITATGLITGIGLNAPATCAAIRCAIDNFQETRFMDSAGEWILGCQVPMEEFWQGKNKLIKMAATAINEVIRYRPDVVPAEMPLLLCLAEQERPGRVVKDDTQLYLDLQEELGFEFNDQSLLISGGHVSVTIALKHARELIHRHGKRHVMVAACDTMLSGATLAYYEEKERLLTRGNSDGFIPGEAGAAMLVESGLGRSDGVLLCEGLGFSVETAHVDSGEPLRAAGLTAAINAAMQEAGCEMGELDFRITDVSGEQYHFKEASLALSRILRQRKEEFDIWHPADCVGEVGSVQGLIMLSVLKAACEKGYSKGRRILAHLGNDDGKRSSMVLTWAEGGSSNGE